MIEIGDIISTRLSTELRSIHGLSGYPDEIWVGVILGIDRTWDDIAICSREPRYNVFWFRSDTPNTVKVQSQTKKWIEASCDIRNR